MVELVMTDLLSTNMKLLLLVGTPSYIRVYLRLTIWSTAILAATNSDPYVAVSTVACLLEYQSVGVPLTMWITGFYPSPKPFWSCTHVNSCQKYTLYINLHILLNFLCKTTLNIQESRKFIQSLKR